MVHFTAITYMHEGKCSVMEDGRALAAVGIWQRVSVLHAVCHSNKSPHPQRPKSVFVSFANKQNVWVLSGWAYGTCQELLVQLYSQTYICCWHSLCLCLSETRDRQPRDFNLPVRASLNMWQSWNKITVTQSMTISHLLEVKISITWQQAIVQ